jgi:glycerol transport system permease protein
MKTQNQRAWLFVTPVLLLVAFNALIPMMTVVNYSVQETFGDNLFFWQGLDWFQQVLTSERFHNALGRQFLFTFLILIIEVPLGVAIALAMPRKGFWVPFCLVTMALPMLIPWNVVGAMWNIFTLPDIGLLGYFMNHVLGISYDMTQDPLAAWVTIVVMDVWHWTSLVVLLAYAGLVSIPNAYYQAAEIDGASRWAVFRFIQLPKMKTVLTIAVLLALHGQLQHLHRALRADRRRSGQLDHTAVDRSRQDRARTVRPRPRGRHVPDLFRHHAAGLLAVLHADDDERQKVLRRTVMRLKSLVPALYILFLMLPIYWLVAMSFKTTNEILAGSRCSRRPGRWPTTSTSSPIRPGTGATSTRSSM